MGETVTDQLAEKNKFVKKLNMSGDIRAIVNDFSVNHKHPKLKEIYELLQQAETIKNEL